MLKPFLEINFDKIPIYYIMMLVGFYLAYNHLDTLLKKESYSIFMKRKVKSTFFIAAIIGLLGANIANWFLFDGLLDRVLIVRLTQGGFSFIFGLVAFLLSAIILLKLRRVGISKAMNLVVEPILIAHFFGRIGCSLRGCCWGKTITLSGMEVMLPIREIEALFLLGLFFIFSKKVKENRIWIYLLSYSSIRFVLEFFRGDDRGCMFGITVLSPSQIMCILLCAISIVVLFLNPEIRFAKLLEKFEPIYRHWSAYEALPDDYEKENTKNTWKNNAIKIACVFVAVFALFVAINPAQLNWCTQLQWKIDDFFSIFTAERSGQETMGEGSGTGIIEVTQETPVDLESGYNVIANVNTWTEANYVPIGSCDISNGAKLYYYLQSVNERPVLGTARTLIADKNSYVDYVMADASSQSYTTKILEKYDTNGVTLDVVFGTKVSIVSSMECWYDTGDGLVAAKHVILSYEGKTPVMGAVLQESNNQIICFTGPDLGILDNSEKTKLLYDSQSALASFSNRKAARGGSWVDIFNKKNNNVVEEAIYEIADTYELSTSQISRIIKSVNDIMRKQDTANLSKFGELFELETRRVLTADGCAEEQIDKICNHIHRLFEEDEDEKAIKITAKERANTFKYKIHYNLDADIFYITSQINHNLEILIDTDCPIRLEVYDKAGNSKTSIYVDNKETIQLYPEDGTDFIVKVKGCKSDKSKRKGDYKLTVKTEERKVEIPLLIQTTLYRVEQSYNDANMMQFFSVYRYEDYSIAEGVIMAAVIPALDSCYSNNGYSDPEKLAKQIIGRELLGNESLAGIHGHLVGSNLTLSYVTHVEAEDKYFVKARVRIDKDEVLLLDKIIRFQLEKAGADDTKDLEEFMGLEGLEFLGEINYCIVDIDTPEIYAMFGDDPNNPNETSDIKSLYAKPYKDDDVDTIKGVEIPIVVFDDKLALDHGYSKEKVNYISQYVKRVNLSNYKEKKEELEYQISCIQSGNALFEGSQILSDVGGSFLDYALEEGDKVTDSWEEKTEGIFLIESIGKGINATYDMIYGAYDEITGLPDKIIGIDQIEENFNDALEESKVLEEIVKEIDKKIRKLERELD